MDLCDFKKFLRGGKRYEYEYLNKKRTWGYTEHSSKEICKLFSINYENRPIPYYVTILRTVNNLKKKTGCVHLAPFIKYKKQPNENAETNIMGKIEITPNANVRPILLIFVNQSNIKITQI